MVGSEITQKATRHGAITADGDKNLLELRRSGMSGLYAEDRVKYDQAIRDFFAEHMAKATPSEGGIQVIEK